MRPGAGTEQSSRHAENGRSYTPDLHQARTYLRDVSLTSISYSAMIRKAGPLRDSLTILK